MIFLHFSKHKLKFMLETKHWTGWTWDQYSCFYSVQAYFLILHGNHPGNGISKFSLWKENLEASNFSSFSKLSECNLR